MKTNNNNIVKTKIDLTKLKANLIPSDDIRRVVKKILLDYKIESLPSIVRSFDLTDISPSEFNVIKCLAIMKNYVSANRDIRHPVYYLENILENADVSVQNSGIAYDDKVVASKMGMLADNPLSYYAGAASTVLNYYTRESDKSISKTFATPAYLAAMKLDDINLEDVRAAVKTSLNSVTLSRDQHYETIMQDPKVGMHLIDRIYSVPKLCDYAVQNDRVKQISQEVSDKHQLQHVAKGNVPSVVDCNFDLKQNVTLEQAWLVASVSRSQIGGEKAGMGSLSSGYYAFDMPTSVIKAVSRAREIKAMLDLLKMTVVKLVTAKDFSLLCMQILARNGIRVISAYGNGLCRKDSKPGIYASSDVSYLNIVSNSFQEPKFSSSGMTYQSRDSFEDAFAGIFAKQRKCYVAVLTYYTPMLLHKVKSSDDKKMSFFPTLSPHTGKMWLLNCNIDLDVKEEEHVSRFLRAVYAKNLYPLTRKPFFTQDELRNLFPFSIIMPKAVRAEKKGVIDMVPEPHRILAKEDVVKIDVNYEFVIARDFKYDVTSLWKADIDFLLTSKDPIHLAESLSYIYQSEDDEYWNLVGEAMKTTDNAQAIEVYGVILAQINDNKQVLVPVQSDPVIEKKDDNDALNDLLGGLSQLAVTSKQKT